MTYVAYWARQQSLAGETHQGAFVSAAIGLVLGIAYLGWFLRKYKALP